MSICLKGGTIHSGSQTQGSLYAQTTAFSFSPPVFPFNGENEKHAMVLNYKKTIEWSLSYWKVCYQPLKYVTGILTREKLFLFSRKVWQNSVFFLCSLEVLAKSCYPSFIFYHICTWFCDRIGHSYTSFT